MSHIGRCSEIVGELCGAHAFLTPSATSALEAISIMSLGKGDEVIMPSWAFPSCANSVILRGATPVFIDVDRDLNLDPLLIEGAITTKTKAVMMIHYAGHVGNARVVRRLCDQHGLYMIEDAAQAIGNWKLVGHFGAMSFHRTKNVECDQGGALLVPDTESYINAARMVTQCGTDKMLMYEGKQDYYSWLHVGGQHVMSEHQAIELEKNLIHMEERQAQRKKIWSIYYAHCPDVRRAQHSGNGHFFWFYATGDKWEMLRRARKCGVKISSHFEALHSTMPGIKYCRTGSPCGNSLEAEKRLLKLETLITEEDALLACEVLWHSSTESGRSTL